MKRIFIGFFIYLFGISFATAAPVIYTIDSAHTFVQWEIEHFGFSKQTGKFFANGTLILDESDPTKSRVNVTLPIAGVDTGIKDLNAHLQGDLFFAAGSNPLATFVSNKIEMVHPDVATVSGLLTIRGITKKVDILVKFNKKGDNIITNKQTVGFSGLLSLKRSDYGMITLLPGLGDRVNLNIQVEAFKA